jgi:hypothetical protein
VTTCDLKLVRDVATPSMTTPAAMPGTTHMAVISGCAGGATTRCG